MPCLLCLGELSFNHHLIKELNSQVLMEETPRIKVISSDILICRIKKKIQQAEVESIQKVT